MEANKSAEKETVAKQATTAIKQPAKKKEPVEVAVKYVNWFSVKLKKNDRLKAHHLNTVLAYFKNRGLTEQEVPSKYDKMLKEFGY